MSKEISKVLRHKSLNKVVLPTFFKIGPTFTLSIVTCMSLLVFVQPQLDTNYYIDEEFHAPQARHYCLGNFHIWDNKITTLPGFYLLSAAIIVPFTWVYHNFFILLGFVGKNANLQDDLCSLIILRIINSLSAPACLYLTYYSCLQFLSKSEKKRSRNSEWTLMFLALSAATFPIVYAPYSFLYYTDVWATVSVFLWYSCYLNKKSSLYLKIFLGMFSVLCRQTNIVWIVLISINDICHCAEKMYAPIKKSDSTISYILACVIQIGYISLKTKNERKKLVLFLKNCFYVTFPNIIVVVMFSFFVFFINNGDIVVGDRKSHRPSIHPMQLFYFVGFCFIFYIPRMVFYFYDYLMKSRNISIQVLILFFNDKCYKISSKIFITLVGISSILIYLNTMAHPFLLSDNRHYIFYVWKLFYGHNKPLFLRYLPVPFYAYGLYVLDLKIKKVSFAFTLSYWLTTSGLLCAQYLLEPRYFVVPFLFYRLHTDAYNSNTSKMAFFEFIIYQFINIVIMWIFLYRPFISTMDNSGRLDRFTW
ncbi:uncharacterized protein LOC126899303 [Daktulosphaira vitifoliae]|uniref:uncharacterized protein LOC126899303 n=1 Tax=Daktulosphaira vitifoliae TaxID=58002 RepID=UPI0021AA60F6|nr:uncharacterized protein LOC126899303 [Daktulosphaira vitifoliae]XP_050530028.1 uncharacterized protein LOC126899303 [Daktulosphaira vitifoliae]XP_050530029.1 uncharacterized protein LOC126899303 [Daktulosphaira vitifoliae]